MTFQGLIYRDEQGHLVQEVTAGQAPALAKPESIIFLAAAPIEKQVSAVLGAVYRVARDMDQDEEYLPTSHTQEGDVYVYAYGRNFKSERMLRSNCFYVGKGTGSRWTNHVWERANKSNNGICATSAKEKAIQTWIEAQKTTDPDALRQLAGGTLVRKIGAWTGKYADSQAFAVEYFLISRLGVHSIANDTNGNVKSKDTVIMARPTTRDTSNINFRQYWARAVAAFAANPNDPAIQHTWNPVLLLIKAEHLIYHLDDQLGRAGINPFEAEKKGKLPPEINLPRHLRVTGASDATLTYLPKEKHVYRLELKLRATQNTVTLNLRPADNTKIAKEKFIKYFDERFREMYPEGVDPIKDRNGAPFFKPFAENAIGRRSAWFSIDDLKRSENGRANWISERSFELNLIEALQLVAGSFLQEGKAVV